MIAIALALHPRLLIADEPTTALDVTRAGAGPGLLRERCEALGTALILVTHDLGVIAQLADRVAGDVCRRDASRKPGSTIFSNAPRIPTLEVDRLIPRLGSLKPRSPKFRAACRASPAPRWLPLRTTLPIEARAPIGAL